MPATYTTLRRVYMIQACVNMYTYISLFESGWERTTRFHGNSPLLSNFSPSLSVLRSPVSIFPSLLSFALRFILVYYQSHLSLLLLTSLAPSCALPLSPSLSPLSALTPLQLSATEENYSLSILEAQHSPTVKPTFSFSLFLSFHSDEFPD